MRCGGSFIAHQTANSAVLGSNPAPLSGKKILSQAGPLDKNGKSLRCQGGSSLSAGHPRK